MAKLLFETAFHVDEEDNLVSYWPERWPVPRLTDFLREGTAFFAASYMNDPTALEGNSLKTAWLHPYSRAELEAARAELRVDRGIVWCGLDPSIGGKEASNLDFFGMFSIEILGSRGYCKDFHFDRLQLDEQGQAVETWLDMQEPDMVILEEGSSKGYVFNELMTQVNDGRGTKWPVQVRHAQGSRDRGGKHIRLQKMAARFQNRQLLVPGEFSGRELIISPSWAPFVNQWRAFPTGHDDILDAAYWAQYEAFELPLAAGRSKPPPSEAESIIADTIIATPRQKRGIANVMNRHMHRRARMRNVMRHSLFRGG